MREFDFTVTAPLGTGYKVETVHALLELISEPLFERYEGEVLPSLCDDALILDCTIEAECVEDAVREVWAFVTSVIAEDIDRMLASRALPSDNTRVANALRTVDPRVGMAYSGLVPA